MIINAFIPKNPFGTALATHISVPQAGKSRANPTGRGMVQNRCLPSMRPHASPNLAYSYIILTQGGGVSVPHKKVRGHYSPPPRLPSVGNCKRRRFCGLPLLSLGLSRRGIPCKDSTKCRGVLRAQLTPNEQAAPVGGLMPQLCIGYFTSRSC